ncbi:uncharacterized protein LOC113293280 [Papaver somniferum]|uniref:uncharacterized protein LOC113293280 n=1 Tax=Papaver somniferum TaxID=3469 RepID=UPI000E7039E2|nr:uncharacterized protein LOC113293280 [Papaver somniferum]
MIRDEIWTMSFLPVLADQRVVLHFLEDRSAWMEFCSNIVRGRVDKTLHLMNNIQELQDPQSELLLLRSCAGVSRLYFALRTTFPEALQVAGSRFDDHLMQYLRRLVVGDGAGFGLIQQRLATLPIKDGGFGVLTMQDTMKYCYLASQAQTQHLQNSILKLPATTELSQGFQHAIQGFTQACGLSLSDFNINDAAPHFMKSLAVIYFGVVKEKVPSCFSLSTRESTIWKCNREEHAMDFLKAIPIPGINQVVGPRQFSFVLQYRLGIPLFEKDSKCACCGKHMDIFGDHAIHCASEVGLKFRHDMAKYVLADICYKAGIVDRKEVSLGLISAYNKELRPADIMVYNWENSRDVCMDVTGVSPFTSARTRNFIPGSAISAAITRKNNKYLDKCTSLGYGFGVLTFTTFGELSPDLTSFLKRLRNCMARHDANFKIGNSLFHRLGIVIQKGVGAQLVARLPAFPCNTDFDS